MTTNFAFCQLSDFNFSVSTTNETCAGNGSISMTVSQTTAGAAITYTLYLYPDTSTPIAQTTEDVFSNLDSGIYRVEARQTLDDLQNNQIADATINNEISILDFEIGQVFMGDCDMASLVVNVSNGNAELYEIISGPITIPLQTENIFNDLTEGTYVVRVFDNCNNALTKTFTLLLDNNIFLLDSIVQPDVLDNCDETTITNLIMAGNEGILAYPISVYYTIYPPDGAAEINFSQTYDTGSEVQLEATETIALYGNQIFDVEILAQDQCSNSVSILEAINPNPKVSMTATPSFCGDNLNINVTNILPPYTLEFTEAPTDFDVSANSDNPDGIYTELNISFGQSDSSLPYGTYSVIVTDSCGRIGTSTIELIEELIEPSVTTSNNGCNPLFGSLSVSIPTREIIATIFTEVPDGYENGVPDDISNFISSNGILNVENLPQGNYILEITDECGSLYVLEINIPIQEELPLEIFTTPNCVTETGTLRIASPYGDLETVFITEAPATFMMELPFDYSSEILSIGIFYVGDLPEGAYTVEFSDSCGNTFILNQVIASYESDSSIYNLERNCGSFNLGIFDNDTSVYDQTYWFQKYIEESDSWGHPNTGIIYTEGEVPNNTNAIVIENEDTLFNIFETGTFRLIKAFQPFNNPNSGQRCLDIFAEFDVVSDLVINGVYNLNCDGGSGPSDVLVDVNGVAPYNFSIVSPLAIDNGDNNIFNNLNPDVYEIRVEDVCGSIETILVNLEDLLPVVNIGVPSDLVICSDFPDAETTFNLSQQNTQLLAGQNPDNVTISYHLSQNDADLGENPISETFENYSNPQTIYARIAHNTLDVCFETASFQLIVSAFPQLGVDETITICDGSSQLLSVSPEYSNYLWSTGEVTSSISVNTAGNYTVTVSQDFGDVSCEATKTFSVDVSGIATIESIITEDFTANTNTILVEVSGFGDYEYSLDGFNYQPQGFFANLQSGNYTVFVKDKNGCGIVTEDLYLLNYKKFFTPNGDRDNQYWQILGSQFEPVLQVSIYNRYGKLLTAFRGDDVGWDGTYNGERMPTSDYWFAVKRGNGKYHYGHFTLKR